MQNINTTQLLRRVLEETMQSQSQEPRGQATQETTIPEGEGIEGETGAEVKERVVGVDLVEVIKELEAEDRISQKV